MAGEDACGTSPQKAGETSALHLAPAVAAAWRPQHPHERMEFTTDTHAATGISVACAIAPSGARVLFVPTPGFRQFSALLAVRAGSCTRRFRGPAGQDIGVPAGTAHFLEHVLFRDADGRDASERFADRGQEVNAATGYTSTTFMLRGRESLAAGLVDLADLMVVLHATPEHIAHERPIITEEIRRDRDSPDAVLHQALVQALFELHPVRDPVLGDEASIATIAPATLQALHGAWFRPRHTVLALGADLDLPGLEAALAPALDRLGAAGTAADTTAATPGVAAPEAVTTPPRVPEEPETVLAAYTEVQAPAALPMALLGVKLADVPRIAPNNTTPADPSGGAYLKRLYALSVLMDLVVGRASPMYEALDADRLIGDDFGGGVVLEPGFGYLAVGGTTPEPETLLARVWDGLVDWRQHPDAAAFARKKHKAYGRLIAACDHPGRRVSAALGAELAGATLFAPWSILAALRLDDLVREFDALADQARHTHAILRPASVGPQAP